MRTPAQVLPLITSIARTKDEVIAVLLAGSRANEQVKPDRYQDYDVTYIVKDVRQCVEDPEWIKAFGKPILMQTPDDMIVPENSGDAGDVDQKFTYLMLFEDHVRIDLTLVELPSAQRYMDSLSTIILDKSNTLHLHLPTPSDSDYRIRKPTNKAFTDCCNEFWWVSTYVVKGLLRKHALYAKHILEQPVRDMLLLMLSWHVGYKNDYRINVGSEYKYLDKYLDEAEWRQLQQSYPDLNLKNIHASLKMMVLLFEKVQTDLAGKLNYAYDEAELRQAKNYLEFYEDELDALQ